jgi:hypothetical protein
MGQANAQCRARRLHGVEQGRWIIEVVPVRERCRQKPVSRFQLARHGLGDDADVRRPFGADTVPQTAVAGEVVIAGEQPPRAGISLHPRHRLHNHAIFWTLGIEDVAGDQDMRRVMLDRGLADRIDRVEARFAERCADIAAKATVRLTQLPVCGVD